MHCRRYLRQFAKAVGLLRDLPAETVDETAEQKAMSIFRNFRRKE